MTISLPDLSTDFNYESSWLLKNVNSLSFCCSYSFLAFLDFSPHIFCFHCSVVSSFCGPWPWFLLLHPLPSWNNHPPVSWQSLPLRSCQVQSPLLPYSCCLPSLTPGHLLLQTNLSKTFLSFLTPLIYFLVDNTFMWLKVPKAQKGRLESWNGHSVCLCSPDFVTSWAIDTAVRKWR